MVNLHGKLGPERFERVWEKLSEPITKHTPKNRTKTVKCIPKLFEILKKRNLLPAIVFSLSKSHVASLLKSLTTYFEAQYGEKAKVNSDVANLLRNIEEFRDCRDDSLQNFMIKGLEYGIGIHYRAVCPNQNLSRALMFPLAQQTVYYAH